ncbi:Uncharacterised protein [uncultured archaeon]|nr:Uncharacterised protein [uncultured archaeon]
MQIEYYRYPADIDVVANPNVNCELSIHVRQELVDMAVRKYLQETADPRYQTKAIESKTELL